MQCPNCQANLESYAVKCEFCGVPLRKPNASMESSTKGEVRLEDSHTEMEKKRSVGVTVFGIVMMLYSFEGLRFSLRMWFGLLRHSYNYKLFIPKEYILMTMIILIYFIATLGVLRLKKWGRVLAVYSSIFSCIFYVTMELRNLFTNFDTIYYPSKLFFYLSSFYLILPLIFLIFFTRPKVKRAFS